MHILLSGVGRLRFWVGLLLLCATSALCASCEDGVLLVLNLDTSAVPTSVTSFAMQASLNGTAGEALRVPASQRRIALHLPAGSTGTVSVAVIGIEDGGCRYTLTSISAPVPGGLSNASEQTFSLGASSGRQCWQPISSLTTQNLYAIAGREQTAYVVGGGGTVLRCTGTACTRLSSGTSAALRGLWIGPSGDVYAAGEVGTLVRCPAGSSSCQLLTSGTSRDLYAVWGLPTGELYTAGDYTTVVFCPPGMASCTPIYAGSISSLRKITGSDTNNIYAVGTGGTVLRCQSFGTFGSCGQVVTGVSDDLTGVAMGPSGTGSTNNAMVVGDTGVILRCLPGQSGCMSLSGAYTGKLFDIAGAGSAYVYGAGEGGTIVRCTGTATPCETLSTRVSSTLRAVWGRPPETDVYAAGEGGVLVSCPGTSASCAVQGSSTQSTLNAIWGSDARNVYVAGDAGALLRRY